MGNAFVNRKEELEFLEKLKDKNFFLVVLGRRRIGKTTLLLKAFPNAAYIFVWPNKTIDWVIEETCKELSLPVFKKFSDILDYLFERGETVIIDEFQNFLWIDKSVYGEIQKVVDKRKIEGKDFKLIVCGSSYSMVNKVLGKEASPLYGRRTHELVIDHLPIKDLFNWLKIPIEDFIKLWSVFQGVPYYYEFIDKSKNAEENIISLLLSKNSILREEGRVVLSVEFGRETKVYFTILSAISEGKTKLSEIASLFGNKVNVISKYLDKLRKELNLVKRITPVFSDPRKSKEGIYEIQDNFLKFWFFFVEKRRAYIEQDKYEEVIDYFNKNFNSYVGKMFEKFVFEILRNRIIKLIDFKKIGKQWGKIKNESYEIDIVASDEKEALFVECKWEENVNALEIVKNLKEKADALWKGKKVFAVFAKSFSKRIEEFEREKVFCFDLKDLERVLKV